MTTKTQKYLKVLLALLISGCFISGSLFAYAQDSSDEEMNEEFIEENVEVAAAGDDTTVPSDVENLKAAAGDTEVQLSWDNSTDNVGVTGYKIYRGTRSVQTSDDIYDLPTIPVGNVKTYTVKNLTNGQKYYFSITAVDAAGNESESYAVEVSATPQTGLHLSSIEDDGAAPKVAQVQAEDIVTVLVVFSEPVQLPEEIPASAFTIEKNTDSSRLQVQKAEIDARDETGKTVLLTTTPQQGGTEYTVTVGIEVQDYFNNPIISGTSDTGVFTGSAKQKPASTNPPVTKPATTNTTPSADTEGPVVTGGKADFNTRIAVNFSEPITLSQNPVGQFTVVNKQTQALLNVFAVSLSPDSKTAYLTTDPQEPVEYTVSVAGITDAAGNEVLATSSSAEVTGKGASIEDLVPPEDVTNFIARIKDARRNIVELRWTPSANTAGDLADQLLYQAEGQEKGAQFGNSTTLGNSAGAVEVHDLNGGRWYTFKLASQDTSGNESSGAITSLYLPQTGPGLIAAGLTSFFMGLYRRRKKKTGEIR